MLLRFAFGLQAAWSMSILGGAPHGRTLTPSVTRGRFLIAATIAQSEFFRGLQSFWERMTDRPGVTVIELLMIGTVVYAVLRFLQGTRSARLVRAVITILVVSFALVWLVAGRYELDRINVLYPYFLLGVFLISLVAFQTELRRMLLRLGEGRLLQRWMVMGDQIIDPIVTAAERLSRKKVGALIAIERGTEIGAVIETGVRLEAKVTTELLETVFWPGTPLHDLGVVISHGRIVAAGCQFPLAESGDLDRALGSRHRAGLGMSLEADAIVIIVSEETGAISVAIHGRLRRAMTGEALRDTLEKELAPATPVSTPTAAREETSSSEARRDGAGKAA